MRQRCNNPKCKVYKYYGARGIKVCKRWDNFANFKKDMGLRPIGYSLDRIDNDGNYKPSNCRWADAKTQTTNRGLNRNNTSGHRGVRFIAGKWRVRVMVDYKEINLGRFTNLNEAIIAREIYMGKPENLGLEF